MVIDWNTQQRQKKNALFCNTFHVRGQERIYSKYKVISGLCKMKSIIIFTGPDSKPIEVNWKFPIETDPKQGAVRNVEKICFSIPIL